MVVACTLVPHVLGPKCAISAILCIATKDTNFYDLEAPVLYEHFGFTCTCCPTVRHSFI